MCKVKKECILNYKDANGKFQVISPMAAGSTGAAAQKLMHPYGPYKGSDTKKMELYKNAMVHCSIHCGQT